MPQVPETAEFDLQTDQIELSTQTNGDVIALRGVRLGKEAAAALAYLINNGATLRIEVKRKVPQ